MQLTLKSKDLASTGSQSSDRPVSLCIKVYSFTRVCFLNSSLSDVWILKSPIRTRRRLFELKHAASKIPFLDVRQLRTHVLFERCGSFNHFWQQQLSFFLPWFGNAPFLDGISPSLGWAALLGKYHFTERLVCISLTLQHSETKPPRMLCSS